MANEHNSREQWTSSVAFLASAAGSAIGLGNIWKFPYIVGANGGGLFVLAYVVCVLVVAYPVLIAEITIGQRAQSNAISAFAKLEGKRTFWQLGGILGLIASVLIIAFYSVVGAWIIFYLQESIVGYANFADTQTVTKLFDSILLDPWKLAAYQGGFLILTYLVVTYGVASGIERMNKFALPLLFALLFYLLYQVSGMPGFSKGVEFMFSLRSDEFKIHSLLEAVGHAFFTLSVGVGIMVTYGSYLPVNMKTKNVGTAIIIGDTLVALLSGLIIFTIIFSIGGEVGQGPVLMFKSLPVLFYQMAEGQTIAIAFFVLVFFTALTSAISLVEVSIAYVIDSGISRKVAVAASALIVTVLAIPCSLSFNSWSTMTVFGKTFFDICDGLSTKILLPLSGIICLLYFNKKFLHSDFYKENMGQSRMAPAFNFCLKYVAPVSIISIMAIGMVNV